MTGQQLARMALRQADRAIRHNRVLTAEEVLEFSVAQVRAPMPRRHRLELALRLAYVALTGRRSWR